MIRNTDHLSWVLINMPDECAKALAHFTESNPHWRGAHWDDCLDALMDADAGLEFTEPIMEDEFLRANVRIADAVCLTLVWADDDFRRTRTNEERMAIVHECLREGGVK